MLNLTFKQVENELIFRILGEHGERWKDDVIAFGKKHDISLRTLRRNGNERRTPTITKVGLTGKCRFDFSSYLSESAVAHEAMVYHVWTAYYRTVDLVAIIPELNKAAFYLGTSGVLGIYHLDPLTTQEGVRLYRDPMQYVRHGRQGILIVDPAKAAYELRGKRLIVDSGEHVRELARLGLGHLSVTVCPLRHRRKSSRTI
jgi:hypothetical protein